MHGVAVLLGDPALGGGGRLHPQQGGGGHLASGHAVDAVVDKDHGDVLPPVGGGEGLAQADGGEIAVPLVGEDQAVRAGALHPGGHGGGPPVGGGDGVVGDVIHVEAAAADSGDHDGLVHQLQLVQSLADELHHGGVHTAGAEPGHLVLLDGGGAGINLFHIRIPLTCPEWRPRP